MTDTRQGFWYRFAVGFILGTIVGGLGSACYGVAIYEMNLYSWIEFSTPLIISSAFSGGVSSVLGRYFELNGAVCSVVCVFLYVINTVSWNWIIVGLLIYTGKGALMGVIAGLLVRMCYKMRWVL